MPALIAARAPYPKLKQHVKNYQDPIFLYFIQSEIGDTDFQDFYHRLLEARSFLLDIKDIRGGKMRIEFGTNFQDAIANAVIEEGADVLVLPVEEKNISAPCEVRLI